MEDDICFWLVYDYVERELRGVGNCFNLGELRILLFEFGFKDWINIIWIGRRKSMNICWL